LLEVKAQEDIGRISGEIQGKKIESVTMARKPASGKATRLAAG